MIELVVGMTLMAVFMTLFTAAITTMYRSANKAESLSRTSTQLNLAFDKLDSSARYASSISTPGRGAGGAWYVELRTTNTGSPVCTQLKVDPASQQVQRRSWPSPLPAGTPVPAWTSVATNITNGASTGGADQPFVLVLPSSTVPYQQLRVHLEATTGSSDSGTSSVADVQFTAVNSSSDSLSSGICTDVARS
jgi:type II secretory pathway pseudopilin PulG